MMISNIVLGVLLLFLGRRLFWLCVGSMGFLVGVDFASTTGVRASEWMILAIFFGILGAVFAVTFQWVAVILAGFLGGGYFLMNIFNFAGQGQGPSSWLLFVIGGTVGMLVMFIAFDWALIAISSLVGAMLIAQNLDINESLQVIFFAVGTLFGMMVQYFNLEASFIKQRGSAKKRRRIRILRTNWFSSNRKE